MQFSVRKLLTIRAAELAGLLLLLAALLLLLARQRRPAFELLRAHLARLGIDVGPATTMEEALRRARPEDAAALEPLIAIYERERFSARASRNARSEIRRSLRAHAVRPYR